MLSCANYGRVTVTTGGAIISPETVFRRLQRINVRIAPGPDGLPNWILREYATLLCDPICAIVYKRYGSRSFRV